MAELIAILIGSLILLALLKLAQRTAQGLNRQYYQKKWQEIKTLQRTSAAASRLAVIEADKLLDKALKESGFRGSTMSDRMRDAGSLLGKTDNVWHAHKLRNRLVHEESKPKRGEIHRSLSAYQAALKKMGAL